MKRARVGFAMAALAVACGLAVPTSEVRAETAEAGMETERGGVAGPEGVAEPEPVREALEAKFKATLEKATFEGRWCSIQDGEMGPEQQDKYTIIGATKVGGDMWLIHTRIQYGERDFVAPLPVQVRWAGDTPVIVVDNLAMPGGTRQYSARVLVYGNTYAGTWSGGEHAGLLKGVITRE
jgi:hypothetical protein